MYDPVRDAASRNTNESSNTQHGNNKGPSGPEPDSGGNASFGTNNPVNERTDTDKLADYLRPFQGPNSSLGKANITANNWDNRNDEMSRITLHVLKVRPDLFKSKRFSKNVISTHFVSQIDGMKQNFPEGNPI